MGIKITKNNDKNKVRPANVKSGKVEIIEEERDQILKNLQNRVDRVIELEMELDQQKEKYENLESAISEEDRAVKKKVISLERNIEQLTLMYNQLVSQKSAIKVENEVNERRILRKNERIAVLEKRLSEQREHVNMLRNQVEALKSALSDSQKSVPQERMIEIENKYLMDKIKSNAVGGKVNAPLKGGDQGGVLTASSLLHQEGGKKHSEQNFYDKTVENAFKK